MEQAIHVGRLDVRITHRAERIRPLVICENEHHIGSLCCSTWPSDPYKQQKKKKQSAFSHIWQFRADIDGKSYKNAENKLQKCH